MGPIAEIKRPYDWLTEACGALCGGARAVLAAEVFAMVVRSRKQSTSFKASLHSYLLVQCSLDSKLG